ncbi:LytTR family transcriptional regulator DNA-binding domain-containing protein [Enterococcus sp. BWM-S5]|uniref:LytTR family transcriptional regulator DNA-binding domain-containing protein n=1 Tax=Enterococcus larvae TaxID=2794352 RepID=A0ABS4CK46_9ENTE|nr:LytTR family transcriptional regulator DNA-binding domain-containing protein [Enterococcus larvae]MBP1046982.1 LytTR family transcriptional regulator DNA-binding domain-containing protein [Enterococcus larvae]
MVTIYLFNQDVVFLKHAQTIVTNLDENRFVVKSFIDYQLLLESIDSTHNAYFIDIKFTDSVSSIISKAKQLREIDPSGKIVYFVPNEEFALSLLNAYVEPFSYFCKNQQISHELFENYLVETIETIFAAIKRSHEKDYLHFQDGQLKKRVERSKVMYVENFSREKKIKVVTTEESFFINTYLGAVREQFDKDTFFLDAQSLIINLTLLHEIQSSTSYVKFSNNTVLSLSPYLLKKLKKAAHILDEAL